MKLEQSFFVGVQDVDAEKKITNKALIEMISNISMLHGVALRSVPEGKLHALITQE